jgi:hypothetical protein
MATGPLKITGAIIPDLVVGLFTESHSAHGAIADLDIAGFHRDRVAIAFSAEGKKAHQEGSHKGHWGEPTPPASEYSLAWKLRHWVEGDTHRRGAEQMSGERPTGGQAGHQEEQYSEVDLHDTLKGVGVPEKRILLLDQILGVDGLLVLVDARERSREARVILEKNCGQIRTGMVTERARLE